jgi:ribose-phosphate pyrophosphokinase
MSATGPVIFAPSASAAFAHEVAALLKVGLAPSEEKEFEGGQHKMRPTSDVRGRDVYVIQQLHGDSAGSVNDRLCRLLFFVGALKDAGAASATVCLPYLAYARKDRRTQPRDPVITRYVALLFEAVGADRVVVLDVHNESAFDNAFRIETVRLDAAELFSRQFANCARNLVVASPDAGGMKRAHQFRSILEANGHRNVETAFMEKIRSSGVLSGQTFVGEVTGAEVVIYDDLIASGSTVLRAVSAARKAGASKVHVAASHAVFSAGAEALFAADGPDTVFVTDSIPLSNEFRAFLGERLRVCSVVPLFAEMVRRLHEKLPLDMSRTG